ncbi:MAG TPA: o-succinylbenzoate synthase [Mycobacteriales bacterium]|nr:o-succinylbenzoate synthase [Mycobacteriales bacterium]
MAQVPALEQVLDGARVVRLPLRVRFRGVDHREAVLLPGPYGWGEFAPFVEYADAEAAWWLASALERAHGPAAASVRTSVPVNATVPAVEPEQVAAVLARFPGCRTAKVKVAEPGRCLDDDVARVAQVRAVLGDGAAVRVDANGGWTVDEAERALRALAGTGLQYAEQPCATVPELVELAARLRRAGVPAPLAADESIRRADDPFAVAATGAVEFAVLKVPPMGGVSRLLSVAARLESDHGVRVVVSSALDTSVGIAAGVAAAAALPRLDLACGLATAGLLAADVTAEPMLAVEGHLPVRDVTPDGDLLRRWQAPPPRRAWWLERLARCHALLRAGAAA